MKQKKPETIKSLFETYFDGCYGIEPTLNVPSTYRMGVCKLSFNVSKNTLTVYLRRPGLLIGKAGITINNLKKYLECNITIKEIQKF